MKKLMKIIAVITATLLLASMIGCSLPVGEYGEGQGRGQGNDDGSAALKRKVLLTTENLTSEISKGYRYFDLIPDSTYTWDDILLSGTENIIIDGNGAKVSPSSTSHCVLMLVNCKNITIRNVRFYGQEANVGGDASSTSSAAGYIRTHWAIKINKGYNNKFINNTFKNWRGGGIAMMGDTSANNAVEGADYFNYATLISENLFERCCVGRMAVSRYEFGRDTGNRYYGCGVGVFQEAGNWSTTSSKFTSCRYPYVSLAYDAYHANFDVNGVYPGKLNQNSEHGTLTSCEFNHANDRSTSFWTSGIGGLFANTSNHEVATNVFCTADGTAGQTGIMFRGVIPPTFTGNTLFYCNVTYQDTQRLNIITGCVLSNMTVKANKTGIAAVSSVSSKNSVTLTNVTDMDAN